METNEIMEVTEAAVDAARGEFVGFKPNDLTKGIMIGGTLVTVGGIVYKFILEPFMHKRKTKKEQQKILDASEEAVVDVIEEIE